MKIRIRLLLTLFFLLVITGVALAEISVQILNAPRQPVLLYSPVFITGAIENNGPAPVLIVVNDESAIGWSFEVTTANKRLPLVPDVQGSSGPDSVAWLKPGEKYFLNWSSLGSKLTEEGVYEVRAVVNGSGQCSPVISRSDQYPLTPLPRQQGYRQFYECWKGEVRSENVSISVAKPGTAEDQTILESILAGKYAEDNPQILSKFSVPSKFASSFPYLMKYYPNSYYTYIAGIYRAKTYGGGVPIEILEDLMALQPNHPLTESARMLWAITVVMEAGDPENNGNWGKDRLSRVLDVDLPAPAKEYVAQLKRLREKQRVQKIPAQ